MSRSPPRFPGFFPISWVFYGFFLVYLTQLFCWCIAALFVLSINLLVLGAGLILQVNIVFLLIYLA